MGMDGEIGSRPSRPIPVFSGGNGTDAAPGLLTHRFGQWGFYYLPGATSAANPFRVASAPSPLHSARARDRDTLCRFSSHGNQERKNVIQTKNNRKKTEVG